jgi:hypothetical protein
MRRRFRCLCRARLNNIGADCEAWNKRAAQWALITSIGIRDWAHVDQT